MFGLLSRIWELRANVSAYDASYIALAESLDCTMLTADRRLARAPGPECPITVVPHSFTDLLFVTQHVSTSVEPRAASLHRTPEERRRNPDAGPYFSVRTGWPLLRS